MVGDAAANAAIAWLSRDSFVPIFLRSKPLHEKMTCEGVVRGIAATWSLLWRQLDATENSMVTGLET